MYMCIEEFNILVCVLESDVIGICHAVFHPEIFSRVTNQNLPGILWGQSSIHIVHNIQIMEAPPHPPTPKRNPDVYVT